MSEVTENLAKVREQIAQACQRAGRKPEDVRLVAVSKMQPVAKVVEAYEAGQRVFAENYVQELQGKAEVLKERTQIRWHFIGRLQRNKAKALVRAGVSSVTVDSLRLIEALHVHAAKAERSLQVCVQVNVSGEGQKGGCSPAELAPLLAAARNSQWLKLDGLMTVPPAAEHAQAARPHFAILADLAKTHGVDGLSMGMSHDFEIAIEEGATEVRIGSAIFGARAMDSR